MTWTDRTPGTWMLGQFDNPGSNGAYTEIGEFPTFRAATEAARRIAKFSKLQGAFSASFCRSHERRGAEVDGFTQRILLEPPKHDPHVEVTLSDGTTHWLEDLEAACSMADLRIQELQDQLDRRDGGEPLP